MHATAIRLLTQVCATAVGNYNLIRVPVVFTKKIGIQKCNRRWEKPFIRTQTHACDCSGETVFPTPPQITTQRNATAPQKSPTTTFPHVHATAYWKTFHLPVPKPTHASADEDLAYSQQQTSMCTWCWGASHSSAPTYSTQAIPARKPPYQNTGSLRRNACPASSRRAQTHMTVRHKQSLRRDIYVQTHRPQLKGHNASLVLTAAVKGLPVSLRHATAAQKLRNIGHWMGAGFLGCAIQYPAIPGSHIIESCSSMSPGPS